MLLDDPNAVPIFAAAKWMDIIFTIAKKMTLLPTNARAVLHMETKVALRELLRINTESFDESSIITSGIDDLEKGLYRLAYLGDSSISEGNGEKCSFCETPLYTESPVIRFCPHCLEEVSSALQRLELSKARGGGFGTNII